MMAGRNGGRKPSLFFSTKHRGKSERLRGPDGRFVSQNLQKTHKNKHHKTDSEPPLRDANGNFPGFDTVMIVDEFGNLGVEPKPHESKFGYVVSITKHPGRFGRVTDCNRSAGSESNEIKASGDPNKLSVTLHIAKTPVRSFAFYVDKNDPPSWWSRNDRVCTALSQALDRTLPRTKGNVFVVVDGHTSYKRRCKVKPLVESKSKPGKTVKGDEFDSRQSECSDLLQTHDYVANAARSRIELHHPLRSIILKTRVRRFREAE